MQSRLPAGSRVRGKPKGTGMYENFYGLSGKPFSLLPDADFMFLSTNHRHAVNLLEYGMLTKAGFIVISGDVGAGKTIIIRRYLKSVAQDVTVGLITNPSATLGRLLGWIAMAFEIPDDGKQDNVMLYNRFVEFLLAQYAKGKRAILIIDEAQNLDAAMLEELRMLSNVNNEKDQLLQIVLVGQPELLDKLRKPELRQFVQRIAVHYHLEPLMPPETSAYIHHRLNVVGGSPALFDATACAAVHYFTGGVPRLINLLCDQALVYGFSEDLPYVNFETVAAVVLERNRAGLSAYRDLPKGWTEPSFLHEIRGILNDIKRGTEDARAV
jgi:general secretion pathway protein A